MKLNDLLEMYNTSRKLIWQETGRSKVALFRVNDEEYDIRINFYDMKLPSREQPLEAHEISFGRYLNDERITKQIQSKYFAQVFGIIYNGILDDIHKNKPGIAFFSAKLANDNNDIKIFNSRLRIYQDMAIRISQHGVYNYLTTPIKSKHATSIILFKNETNITPEEIQWIRDNI